MDPVKSQSLVKTVQYRGYDVELKITKSGTYFTTVARKSDIRVIQMLQEHEDPLDALTEAFLQIVDILINAKKPIR